MSLAAKLPYNHPYAGGYPGIGSQPLPSDGDALTYLAAVADADGAGVEVGVANAVDAFIKGCKADGVWDAIKASCILAGARTLNGALVPLTGTAPTNVADGFVEGDYNRETGLKGDGTSYLDVNDIYPEGPQQNSSHLAVYVTVQTTATFINYVTHIIERDDLTISGDGTTQISQTNVNTFTRSREGTGSTLAGATSVGLQAISRSSASQYSRRINGTTAAVVAASSGVPDGNAYVFQNGNGIQYSDARLAFYSIGESLDLAALDTHVSNLVANIGAAL